jgi:hypothetical protein
MEASERAFDIVVLADLAPAAASEPAVHRVDRDNLAELLARLAPEAKLGTARIAFGDFKAFRPEALAAVLPATRAILELKRRARATPAPSAAELMSALDALPADSADVAALNAALGGGAGPSTPAAAPPPPPPTRPAAAAPASSSGGSLDALFDMVDAGASTAAPPVNATRALDALIANLSARRRGRRQRCRGHDPAARQGAPTRRWRVRCAMRPGEPRWQAVESAWMGLRFLTRRMDFRTGIRLHVISCSRARLVEAFRGVLTPFADGARAEGRTVCAIDDFAFGADHEEELLAFAQAAEGARVPVVANAAVSLLGVRTFAEMDKLDNLGAVLADDDHVRYGAIRDDEAARWVSLVLNRLLLRAPYGAEHERVRDFTFEENPIGEDAHYLWGGAAWGIGALIAASVERTGWGTVLLGPGDDTSLADLPVRPLTLRTGEVVNCPLEALLSEPRVLELSEGGLTALACRRNSDAAFTVSAVTLRRPSKGEGRAAASEPRRVSLAYALFLTCAGVVVLMQRRAFDARLFALRSLPVLSADRPRLGSVHHERGRGTQRARGGEVGEDRVPAAALPRGPAAARPARHRARNPAPLNSRAAVFAAGASIRRSHE